jgi:hypothetical protein
VRIFEFVFSLAEHRTLEFLFAGPCWILNHRNF